MLSMHPASTLDPRGAKILERSFNCLSLCFASSWHVTVAMGWLQHMEGFPLCCLSSSHRMWGQERWLL